MYRRAPSNAERWEAPRRVDAADWLALLIILALICVGAIITPLNVAEYRWGQEFISGVAGSLFVLSVEMLLIWRAPSVARLVNAFFSPLVPSTVSSKIIIELRTARETVKRHANTRQSCQSLELGRLRASAERCFSLAERAISQSLANELEALGRDFEREAQEIERQILLEPL
jgi:hypothetical protein